MGIGREILRGIGELILGDSKEAGQFLDAIETVTDNSTKVVKKVFSHKSNLSDDDYEFTDSDTYNDTLNEFHNQYETKSTEKIVDTLFSKKISDKEANILYHILKEERNLSDDNIQIIHYRKIDTDTLLGSFYDVNQSESLRQILKNVITQSRNIKESDLRFSFIKVLQTTLISIFHESDKKNCLDEWNVMISIFKEQYNLDDKEVNYLKQQVLQSS